MPCSQLNPPRMVARRDLLVAALLAGVAVAGMADAWHFIFRISIPNEELGYVLLAPVAITWIALARRGRLRECRARGGWVGLVILAAGWLAYWHGRHTDPVLWRAGAVIAVVGAVLAALGSDVLRHFLPALAAAVFLIPVDPNGRFRLALPLQSATAQVTQSLCELVGIPVDRAGNTLTVNGVDVAVAEACNGMRMVLTIFLVCYVVAFKTPLRAHVRILFLLATPLVAIAANVARLVPTVWLFGHSSKATAEKFHDISGWVMSVAAFLFLMALVRLFRQTERE